MNAIFIEDDFEMVVLLFLKISFRWKAIVIYFSGKRVNINS